MMSVPLVMKKILLAVFIVIIVIFSTSDIQAEVVINEVSPASDPEWVELYNTSSTSASLKGYSINFGTDSQNKYFCDNEVANENSYRIISLTSHWLADSGDIVTLKNGDDVVNAIGYGSGHSLGKPIAAGSISRLPDGGSDWVLLSLSTQQGGLISFDCPTPTPTATPQPEPTATPLPTPTKSPSPVPTSTKKPTPISTKVPVPTPTASFEEKVLGIEFISPTPTVNSVPVNPTEESRNKVPFLAVGLIVAGFCLIGFSIFSIIKNFKKGYNDESEKQDSKIS
jgi:hypothetical protein